MHWLIHVLGILAAACLALATIGILVYEIDRRLDERRRRRVAQRVRVTFEDVALTQEGTTLPTGTPFRSPLNRQGADNQSAVGLAPSPKDRA